MIDPGKSIGVIPIRQLRNDSKKALVEEIVQTIIQPWMALLSTNHSYQRIGGHILTLYKWQNQIQQQYSKQYYEIRSKRVCARQKMNKKRAN